jgi:UDP-GlcNAc:undecaprenyl-phosphate GlcNAc-1-phosphate transferase
MVSRRHGWFDSVNERKIHAGQIPRLGGVGIFWSFYITLVVVALFSKETAKDALVYWPVGVSMMLVHFVGLLDDFKDLRARLKFLVHLAAAIIVVIAGYRFRAL